MASGQRFALMLLLALPLAYFSPSCLAITVDEDGEVVVDADEDAPPELDDGVEETPQYDPVTGARTYGGYRVIRAMPDRQEHLDVLRFVANGIEDYWTPIPATATNASLMRHVDMMVGPKHFSHVVDYLDCSGVPYEIAIQDLQEAIDQENLPAKKEATDDELVGRQDSCPQKVGYDWNNYHKLDDFNYLIDCLAAEHPDKVEVLNIGSSYEGRPLRVLKIGRDPRTGQASHDRSRQAVWIDGGIHAREWISPTSVIYMATSLLQEYNRYSDIVDTMDVYVMPVINVDGYVYTWTNDRLWRKTRSRNRGSSCVGVDPNRNWGHKFGGEGASPDPCSEIYHGPRAFSERETKAVSSFIMKQRQRLRLYLTYHSYGQYILYPWGWTNRGAPKNHRKLKQMAEVMHSAMNRVSGRRYSVGTAAQVLYPAAGGSDDWAKGSARIEYSYTVELPDTGRYGFVLPNHYIDGTVKEAMAGAVAMIRAIRDTPPGPKN